MKNSKISEIFFSFYLFFQCKKKITLFECMIKLETRKLTFNEKFVTRQKKITREEKNCKLENCLVLFGKKKIF